jgi:hypothetical protein
MVEGHDLKAARGFSPDPGEMGMPKLVIWLRTLQAIFASVC